MTDWKDRLVENLLDEKLGGITPPNQVDRILSAAYETSRHYGPENHNGVPVMKLNGSPVHEISPIFFRARRW